MRVDDLTVEVRDRTLKRVGQVTPRYLDLKGRTKWCGVGEWTLTLPGDHPMVPYLSQPGSGLLVTGPAGFTLHPATYSPWESITWDQHMAPAGSFTRSGVAAAQNYVPGTEVDVQPGQVIRAVIDWSSTDPADSALFGLGAYKDGVWEVAGSGDSAWGGSMSRWIGPVYSTDRTRRVKHFVVPEGVTKVMFSHYKNGGTGLYTYTMGLFVVPVEDPDIRVTYAGTPPALGAPSNVESTLERRTLLRGPWRETVYDTLFSGPTRTPTRLRNQQNPDGTFTFSGVTDEILLQGARAFPDPTIADPQASSQSKSNDSRTGTTEALLRQFVAYNITSAQAPAGRKRGLRQYLDLAGSSQGRGLTQSKSPRFQNLLELLQEMIAYDPSLGFRVVQVGSRLQFQVLDARDRTAFVRFDVENGTIVSEEVQTGGPVVTDAIVAGQGEGTARTIVRRQTPEAIAAENEWGVVFENFIDQRDTDDLGELQQSGDEALLEGAGGTAVKMVPADDMTMQVNVDWRQGDAVTTVVSGIETVARVTEVAYSITSSGVLAGAALGDVSGFTQKDAESAKVQSIDSRVSNLERASAGPVDWERITGQPEAWAPIAQKNATAPPSDYPMGQSVFFSNGATGWPSTYGIIQTVHGWSAGGGTLQFWTGYNAKMGELWMRQWPYPSGPWGAWVRVDGADWATLRGKPSVFAPAAHSHAAADLPIASETVAQDGLSNTALITPLRMTQALEVPDQWVGNGQSSVAIGSTGWGSIAGALRCELPAYTRDLVVDVEYGALGSTSSGYWMIGASIFNADSSWTIPPEEADPSTGVTGSIYGLFAPFSQATQHVQLFGTKRIVIPAGTEAIIQMAARKSVSGATASMNYSSMVVKPVKWK